MASAFISCKGFFYLAEAQIDKRHRRITKWVLHRDITVKDLMATDRLVEETKVETIIGMERWEEVSLVADIAKVPILSFAAPSMPIPIANSHWPTLVRLGDENFGQMKCIAELVQDYSWRRVVTVHEDYAYRGNFGEFAANTAPKLLDFQDFTD